MSTKAMFDSLAARMAERGAEVLDGGKAYRVHTNGSYAVVIRPPNVTLEPAAAAVARAYMAIAGFAQDAARVHADARLSVAGKAEDLAALATAAGSTIAEALATAGTGLEQARAELAREVAPVPIEPATAADAVIDSELRGLLRDMAPHDQMGRVREDMASCRALLRMPTGFLPQTVDFAREAWAAFNPTAPTATNAQQAATSWESARNAIGSAQDALRRLSAGRTGPVAAAAA
jgi:hypothetical protein